MCAQSFAIKVDLEQLDIHGPEHSQCTIAQLLGRIEPLQQAIENVAVRNKRPPSIIDAYMAEAVLARTQKRFANVSYAFAVAQRHRANLPTTPHRPTVEDDLTYIHRAMRTAFQCAARPGTLPDADKRLLVDGAAAILKVIQTSNRLSVALMTDKQLSKVRGVFEAALQLVLKKSPAAVLLEEYTAHATRDAISHHLDDVRFELSTRTMRYERLAAEGRLPDWAVQIVGTPPDPVSERQVYWAKFDEIVATPLKSGRVVGAPTEATPAEAPPTVREGAAKRVDQAARAARDFWGPSQLAVARRVAAGIVETPPVRMMTLAEFKVHWTTRGSEAVVPGLLITGINTDNDLDALEQLLTETTRGGISQLNLLARESA